MSTNDIHDLSKQRGDRHCLPEDEQSGDLRIAGLLLNHAPREEIVIYALDDGALLLSSPFGTLKPW